jgi:hypothetical protein
MIHAFIIMKMNSQETAINMLDEGELKNQGITEGNSSHWECRRNSLKHKYTWSCVKSHYHFNLRENFKLLSSQWQKMVRLWSKSKIISNCKESKVQKNCFLLILKCSKDGNVNVMSVTNSTLDMTKLNSFLQYP